MDWRAQYGASQGVRSQISSPLDPNKHRNCRGQPEAAAERGALSVPASFGRIDRHLFA